MSQQVFLGRFSINADSDTFNIGANQLNLTTGEYYLSGYDGESNGLCYEIQTKIRTLGLFPNANVRFYPANMDVAISLDVDANVNIVDASLAHILGYGLINDGGINDVTHSANRQRYTWAPSRAPSDYPTDINSLFEPRSRTTYGRTDGGTTYSVPRSTLYDGYLEYSLLPMNEAILSPSNGIRYSEFEQFFKDVICEGNPFRVILDKTAYANTDHFKTCMFGDDGGSEVGALDEVINRYVGKYNGLWNVNVPFLKFVGNEEF